MPLLLLLQCVPGHYKGHSDISGKGAAGGPVAIPAQPSGLLLLRNTRRAQLQNRVRDGIK
jgi:hypothetical protein